MRRFSCLGIALVAITLIIGVGWLGVRMVSRSFVPDGEAEGSVDGLSSDVRIVRDGDGVTYVTASNELDAYAAVGYAQAQDRLWQMDLARRAGMGRLSEIFGRPAIAFDALARTVGFQRIAARILAKMPAGTLHALEAYSRGVNAYIEEHRGRYPFEFDAIGYQPEPWTPLHSVLIARMLGWELNTSFRTDVVFGELAYRVEPEKLEEILPYWPTYAPTIIPGGQRPESLLQRLENALPPAPRTEPPNLDSLDRDTTGTSTDRSAWLGPLNRLDAVVSLDRSMRRFLGMDGSLIGSNAWAVSGSKTATGRAMLANDPHLGYTAPSRWYQVVLHIGKHWIAGVSIPGAPFVIAGRNDDIAWGLTSMQADQTDFYVERLDSSKSKMLHDGRWEPLTIVRDTIRVRDSASVPIVVRIGRHGPLISDVHPYATAYEHPVSDPPVDSTGALASEAVSMRWAGRDVTQEMAAFKGINEARTLSQFVAAARLGGVPALGLVYADRSDNIAFVPSARIPVRGEADPNRPNPGWESRFNWKGVYPMERLPVQKNPARGYVAMANNRIANDLPFFVSDLWDDPSRAIRLDELLSTTGGLSQIDFVQMQSDEISPHMRYMVEFLLRAFPDSLRQGKAIQSALSRLRHWSGTMLAESPEAAIAAVWLQRVIEATYRDEMGPVLFDHYVRTSLLPIRAIRHHLMTDSQWFDDVETPKVVEHRDDILRKCLGEALNDLHARFSTWNFDAWHYGAFHTLTIPHPLGSQKAIAPLVNIGPFDVGGSATTLNNAEWNFADPYSVVLGPSMRQIVDFADTDAFVRSVITTGSSGQPLSRFYNNQTALFRANGYLSLRRRMPSRGSISSTTTLHPSSGE